MRSLEDHVQNKHGEKCVCADVKARDSLKKVTTRKVEIVAGVSAHVEKIKVADDNNKRTDCLMCIAEES